MISVASNWQRISGHVLKERTAFGERTTVLRDLRLGFCSESRAYRMFVLSFVLGSGFRSAESVRRETRGTRIPAEQRDSCERITLFLLERLRFFFLESASLKAVFN